MDSKFGIISQSFNIECIETFNQTQIANMYQSILFKHQSQCPLSEAPYPVHVIPSIDPPTSFKSRSRL